MKRTEKPRSFDQERAGAAEVDLVNAVLLRLLFKHLSADRYGVLCEAGVVHCWRRFLLDVPLGDKLSEVQVGIESLEVDVLGDTHAC